MRGGSARLALAILVVAGLVACRPAQAEDRMRIVEVTIHYSRFTPSALTFEPGTTVRFEIRNTDPIDHEFILGNEEVQAVHERGTEAHHGARPGEISIPAGTTRTTTYTFAERGALIFGCHFPGHYAFGMRGTVTAA
ncbi:MAG: cupredoxin domain-containing protein [Actinomycetota bacterium]